MEGPKNFRPRGLEDRPIAIGGRIKTSARLVPMRLAGEQKTGRFRQTFDGGRRSTFELGTPPPKNPAIGAIYAGGSQSEFRDERSELAREAQTARWRPTQPIVTNDS